MCLCDVFTNIPAGSFSTYVIVLTLSLSYIETHHKLNFILLMFSLVKAIIMLSHDERNIYPLSACCICHALPIYACLKGLTYVFKHRWQQFRNLLNRIVPLLMRHVIQLCKEGLLDRKHTVQQTLVSYHSAEPQLSSSSMTDLFRGKWHRNLEQLWQR